MPRKWRGNEGEEKAEIAIGDCIKSDLERVGEECEKVIARRKWRLLT